MEQNWKKMDFKNQRNACVMHDWEETILNDIEWLNDFACWYIPYWQVSRVHDGHLSSEGEPDDYPSDKETEAADDNEDVDDTEVKVQNINALLPLTFLSVLHCHNIYYHIWENTNITFFSLITSHFFCVEKQILYSKNVNTSLQLRWCYLCFVFLVVVVILKV